MWVCTITALDLKDSKVFYTKESTYGTDDVKKVTYKPYKIGVLQAYVSDLDNDTLIDIAKMVIPTVSRWTKFKIWFKKKTCRIGIHSYQPYSQDVYSVRRIKLWEIKTIYVELNCMYCRKSAVRKTEVWT